MEVSNNFVILAHYRTGSTWLTECLQKQVNVEKEPFKSDDYVNFSFRKKQNSDFNECLLKLGNYKQIISDIGKQHNEMIINDNSRKIIYLYRKNKLQQCISMLISEKVKKFWNIKNQKQKENMLTLLKKNKFLIDLDRLDKSLKSLESFENFVSGAIKNTRDEKDYIFIAYEDLFEKYSLQLIKDFIVLNRDINHNDSNIMKINNNETYNCILNKKEIEKHFGVFS